MALKKAFEALDRTLQDIRESTLLMAEAVVVLAGHLSNLARYSAQNFAHQLCWFPANFSSSIQEIIDKVTILKIVNGFASDLFSRLQMIAS